MDNEKYIELLLKQQDGLASADEQADLERWLSASEENRIQADAALSAYRSADQPAMATDDLDQAYKELQQRISSARPVRRLGRSALLRVAVLLALAALALWLWQTGPTPSSAMVLVGPQQDQPLADGSRVWLEDGSEISYVEDASRRVIELAGTMFIQVASAVTQPFTVEAELGSIRVTGTAFEVRADVDTLRVTVQEGQVLFYTADRLDSLYLGPGEGAVLTSAQSFTPSNAEDQAISAWRSEEIRFEDADLEDITEVLSAYYAAEFTYANDALRQCALSFTLTFPVLDEALASLELLLGVDITQTTASQYLISGSSCQ